MQPMAYLPSGSKLSGCDATVELTSMVDFGPFALWASGPPAAALNSVKEQW